jgi:hypothetical protein
MATRSGLGRATRMVALFGVLGLIGIGFGVRTLRRGEVDTETGELTRGQAPVPMRMIVAASSAVSLVVMAIAAWPLGLYTWMGTLDSGCRALVTADELTRVLGVPVELGSVSDQSGDLHCSALFVAAANGAPIAQIEIGGDLGGAQFENHVDFLARRARRAPIEGLGEEAYWISTSSGGAIALRAGHAGATVDWIGTDPAVRDRLVELLRARTSVLAPYAERWVTRYGDR